MKKLLQFEKISPQVLYLDEADPTSGCDHEPSTLVVQGDRIEGSLHRGNFRDHLRERPGANHVTT